MFLKSTLPAFTARCGIDRQHGLGVGGTLASARTHVTAQNPGGTRDTSDWLCEQLSNTGDHRSTWAEKSWRAPTCQRGDADRD